MHGGESKLYSGYRVYNSLIRQPSNVIDRLYKDFTFARHDDEYPDGMRFDCAPILSLKGQEPNFRFGRYWIDLAESRGDAIVDAEGRVAISAIEASLADAQAEVRFMLNPGEMMFVDNLTVFHARSSFVDSPDPSHRRTLLRAWLD